MLLTCRLQKNFDIVEVVQKFKLSLLNVGLDVFEEHYCGCVPRKSFLYALQRFC